MNRYQNHALALLLAFVFKTPFFSLSWLRLLSVSAFIRFLFLAFPSMTICQIGANDGQSNDPLYPYLKFHLGKVVLVEALPYYVKKLQKLWNCKPNVLIVNALVTADTANPMCEFFYIDPAVADLMDGNGPPNKWAHGQGSLEKDVIIETIKSNSFRGLEYRKNISYYLNSIQSVTLPSVSLATLLKRLNLQTLDFLVLDVQGAELSILIQLRSLECLPSIIMYESDLSAPIETRQQISLHLSQLGYVFLTGNSSDKIYILPKLLRG